MRVLVATVLTSGLALCQPHADRPHPRIVNGDVRPPQLIFAPPVSIPPLAKAARIRGVVQMAIEIDPQGRVVSVQVRSGHPLLVSAAMDAAKRRRYRPATALGSPISMIVQLDMEFRTEFEPVSMLPLSHR